LDSRHGVSAMAFVPSPPPSRKRRARRIRYYKKSGVYATPAGYSASGGTGETRRSVLLAAEVFAATARALGASLCKSRRIPAATAVLPVGEQSANVETDGGAAPNAAPFEFGERHPLWGRWVTGKGKQPKRPYLDRTAKDGTTINSAGDIYADAETALLAEEYDLEIT
jgi:hypothetical protein